MSPYIPSAWYWIVAGDATKWWSGASASYVAPVQGWLDAGNLPTRIASEAELSAVLAAYGLPGPDLKAFAAAKRYHVEIGGIAVNGASIQTDRASQAMLTGLYAYASSNPGVSINFKAVGGFVTLTAAQAIAIGEAVGAHVQACFAAEQLVDADIDAGTITAAGQIDSDARWPSNG